MFMYTNMCIYIYIYTHRCICHSNITNKLASVPPPSQALLAAAAALNRLSQKICLSSLLLVVVLLVLVLVLVLVLLYITYIYIYIYIYRQRERDYIHILSSVCLRCSSPRPPRRCARASRRSPGGPSVRQWQEVFKCPKGPPRGKTLRVPL